MTGVGAAPHSWAFRVRGLAGAREAPRRLAGSGALLPVPGRGRGVRAQRGMECEGPWEEPACGGLRVCSRSPHPRLSGAAPEISALGAERVGAPTHLFRVPCEPPGLGGGSLAPRTSWPRAHLASTDAEQTRGEGQRPRDLACEGTPVRADGWDATSRHSPAGPVGGQAQSCRSGMRSHTHMHTRTHRRWRAVRLGPQEAGVCRCSWPCGDAVPGDT